MSLANAMPVHVHMPASGSRFGSPLANADAATSRHTMIPRHRIFIVSLLAVLGILRPDRAFGLPLECSLSRLRERVAGGRVRVTAPRRYRPLPRPAACAVHRAGV